MPANDRPTLLRASHFKPEGMLRLKASRLERCAEAPILSLFWAAGFPFSRSELLTKVRIVLSCTWSLIMPAVQAHCVKSAQALKEHGGEASHSMTQH